MMLGKKVGIDLGSSRVRVVVKGEGLVLDEPSVVAIGGQKHRVSAFGGGAAAAAKANPDLLMVHPVDGWRIADIPAVAALLAHVINRSAGRQRIFKPDIVLTVHTAMAGDDRRQLLDILAALGARTMYLLDIPLAAATGSGATLTGPVGHLVIDVGAAVAEVAVLAHEGMVAGRCIEIRGRDGRVSDGWVSDIVNAAREVLAEMPQQLMSDIAAEGILLTGGGSVAAEVGDQLTAALGVPITRPPEPELCAARGAGLAVDTLDVIRRSFMYIR